MKSEQELGPSDFDFVPPIALDRFAEISGLSRVTLYRYRQRGWLKTHAIGNRQYVLAADVAEFNRRAEAGEFASESQPNPSVHR